MLPHSPADRWKGTEWGRAIGNGGLMQRAIECYPKWGRFGGPQPTLRVSLHPGQDAD